METMMKKIIIPLSLLLLSGKAFSQVSVPNSFNPNDPISASQMNANFNALVTAINGLSGGGISSLNGQNTLSQSFAVDTLGSSPTWSSAAGVHTLNIPMAAGTGVTAGLISKAEYDNFMTKIGPSGGTISGNLSLTNAPVNPSDAVNKQYVDNALSGGSGITTLNTLTSSSQTLGIGSTGTSPNWNSSGAAHVMNIPMASNMSVTAGLISKTEYDSFNNKIGPNGGAISGNLSISATPVNLWDVTNKEYVDNQVGTKVSQAYVDNNLATRSLSTATPAFNQVLTWFNNGSGGVWKPMNATAFQDTNGYVGIGTTAPDNAQLHVSRVASNTTPEFAFTKVTGFLEATGGVQYGSIIQPSINQTGTAGYTGLLVNVIHNTSGSGPKQLLELKTDGTTKFAVDNHGFVTTSESFMANGAGTINGTCNVDATNVVSLGTLTMDYGSFGGSLTVPAGGAVYEILFDLPLMNLAHTAVLDMGGIKMSPGIHVKRFFGGETISFMVGCKASANATGTYELSKLVLGVKRIR
jgi:hypothetical protein